MTDRRLVNVIEEHKRAQALVWNGIRQAAMLIEAANPQAILDAIEGEGGWDSGSPDMTRKRQALEAAAAFQREWSRIRFEALTADEEGANK